MGPTHLRLRRRQRLTRCMHSTCTPLLACTRSALPDPSSVHYVTVAQVGTDSMRVRPDSTGHWQRLTHRAYSHTPGRMHAMYSWIHALLCVVQVTAERWASAAPRHRGRRKRGRRWNERLVHTTAQGERKRWVRLSLSLRCVRAEVNWFTPRV